MITSAFPGYRHPKCYANGDGRCSSTISKEHYVSEGLMRRLDGGTGTALIAGLSWQPKDQVQRFSIKALASNILCTSHNSELSPLDAEALKFVSRFSEIDHSGSSGSRVTKIDGGKLERWMLKCVVGWAISGNADFRLKPECIDILFGRAPWPSHWGLYFQHVRSLIHHTDNFQMISKVSDDKILRAAEIRLQGLPLFLVLGSLEKPATFGVWRPSEFRIGGTRGRHSVRLKWNGDHGGQVRLTRTKTYKGAPPDWPAWANRGNGDAST